MAPVASLVSERDISTLAVAPNEPQVDSSVHERLETKTACAKVTTQDKLFETQEVQKLRSEIEVFRRCLPGKGDGFPRLLQRLEGVVDRLSLSPLSKTQ